MHVYAFDRDSTLDVNPPDDGSPGVPLEWVRYLAHETEHVVWATGNQALTTEVDIPGDEEAIEGYRKRWGDPRDHIERRPAPNLEVQVLSNPDAPDPDLTTAVHQFVTEGDRLDRHQRVRLVGALNPEAERRIAVDNRYLGFAEGWEHYQSWEFIEAIENGSELFDLDPAA